MLFVEGRKVWEDRIDQAGLMRNVIDGRDIKNLNRKKQNMNS